MSEAVDVVRDLQTDDRLRALAISREIAEHDAAQALDSAERRGIALGEQRGIALGEKRGIALGEQRGIALGEKRGIALGEQRGIALGERTVIQRMLTNGFDVSHIAKATGYTEQQIATILKEKRG
jgi:predicted transposase YdaD